MSVVEAILARDWLSWDRSRWPNVLVAALFFGLLAVTPPAMAANGTISGIVTDSDGQPLGNVSVYVYRYEDRWGYWDTIEYGYTDWDGSYAVTVPEGEYRACFRRSSFPLACYDSAGSVESADDFVVAGDENITIDQAMPGFSHFTGTLTDPNGDPIPGVRADAYNYDRAADEWYSTARAVTDADGNYDIKVGAGTYRLGFARRNREYTREFLNDADTVWEASDLTINGDETNSNNDATLSFNPGITGTVSRPGGWDDDSLPEDNRVQVIDSSTGAVVGRGRVGLDGRYGVWGLEAGSYRVAFNRLSGPAFAAAEFYDGIAENQGLASGDVVTLAEGQRRTDVNASLQEGGSVQGTLVDQDGAPVDRCVVQAYTPNNSLVTRSAVTDETGNFTIGGLSTGDYLFRTGTSWRRMGCDGGTQYFVGTQSLGLEAADVEQISITRGNAEDLNELTYVRGGRITGQIEFPEGAEEDRRVVVRDIETNEVVGADRADSEGFYEVDGLLGGTYRVSFNRLSGTAVAAAQFFDRRNEDAGIAAADVVTVGLGERRTGVDATLRVGGSITGVLTNVSDEPIARCQIQAYSTDGHLVTRSTWTEDDGSFVIGGLATGEYLVRAGAGYWRSGCRDGEQFLVDPDGALTRDAENAQPLAINQGDATSAGTLTYLSSASVSGQVILPEGATFNDRSVVVRNQASGEVAGVTRVRRDGSYRVGGLGAGTYRVTFNRLSGNSLAAPEFYNNHPEGDGPGSANLITLGLGESRSDVDAELIEGGGITGVLVDGTGDGVSGCLVQAFSADGSLVTRSTYSSPAGRFRVGGLSTGNYLLRALPSYEGGCRGGTQYFSGAGTLSLSLEDAAPIEVMVGQPSPLADDLVYQIGATIRGRLNVPKGANYNDREVQVVNTETGEIVRAGYADASEPIYSVRGLVPGSYRVEFARSSGPATVAAEFYDDVLEGEGVASAQLVDVAWGELRTGINATLVKGGTISGTLTDEEGNPLRCLVEALTEDDSLVRREDYPDRAGNFKIGGLSTGSYVLRVRGNAYAGCGEGDRFYAGETGVLVPEIGKAVGVATVVGQGLSLPNTLIYGTPALQNLTPPTIAGEARVGRMLTADPGTWSPPSADFAYAWLAGGVAIPGATGVTYLATAADVGKALGVRVTASAEGYDSVSATSAETLPVLAAEIVNTLRPSVSGSSQVGQRVTAVPGTWTPANATFSYRWLADDRPITGADAASLTIPASLLGKRLSVEVTASAVDLTSASARSTASVVQPGVIVIAVNPSIRGRAKVGKKLSIVGAITEPTAVKAAYQWLRNGKRIRGATAAKYRLTRADRGKQISARITYTKVGYTPTLIKIRLAGRVR